jgi:branched-chain amino acid transport system permease protein
MAPNVHAVTVIIVGGLSEAVPLFLIASGLTLIYGVMGILNFAHGGMFMFGAYLLVWILGGGLVSAARFVVGAFLAAVIVGAMGLIVEPLLYRPLYRFEPQVSLLGSYGLLLFLVGLAPVFWGDQFLSQDIPPSLAGQSTVLGNTVSNYNLMEIAAGLVTAVLLALLLKKTTIGLRATALAEDREMARALGVRASRVNLIVFGLGSFLAGLAGALIAPTVSISPSLGVEFVIEAFTVVLMGGLGSVEGALLAAIIVGIADTTIVTYVPALTGYSFYIILGIFVAVRPQGLFGRLTASETQPA